MQKKVFVIAVLTILFNVTALSQGWQSLGPDSLDWLNVRDMSIRWSSQYSYDIAVHTSKGVAFHPMASPWSYSLTNGIGTSYIFGAFSPWNDDSIFIATSEYYGRFDYHIHLCKYQYPSLSYDNEIFPVTVGYAAYSTPDLTILFGQNSDSICMVSLNRYVSKSLDRGRTWQDISYPGTCDFGLIKSNGIASSIFVSEILYSDMTSSILLRSTDRGLSWDSLFCFESINYNHIYSVGDTILICATVSDTVNPGRIYRSSNAGTTWVTTYIGGTIAGIVGSQVSSSTLFSGGEDGVLKSVDYGLTWISYNNSLVASHITDIAIDPYSDTLFVATETHGLLKVWNYLTSVDERTKTPMLFELMQNYPNPFNPTTVISYMLPKNSMVTLKVYDVLGREVKTLVNERQNLGAHKITFNANNLPSGVFFYRLVAGSFINTKKLIVIK